MIQPSWPGHHKHCKREKMVPFASLLDTKCEGLELGVFDHPMISVRRNTAADQNDGSNTSRFCILWNGTITGTLTIVFTKVYELRASHKVPWQVCKRKVERKSAATCLKIWLRHGLFWVMKEKPKGCLLFQPSGKMPPGFKLSWTNLAFVMPPTSTYVCRRI